MPTQPAAGEWITVEEATDERLAAAVARRLRQDGVPVRLAPADPSDPSRARGDLTVQVPLEDFVRALEVLEELDGEDL
jgi:7-keto-8-aminopelargonate synthetase-like enzyme